MQAIERALEERLAPQGVPLAVVLPGGRRLGSPHPRVTLRLHELASLAHIATGQVGRVAQDYVEGRLDIDGSMRDLMHVAAQIVGDEPIAGDAALPITWWRNIVRAARARATTPRRTRSRCSSTTTCPTPSTTCGSTNARSTRAPTGATPT